jgi:glyoxylate reductase
MRPRILISCDLLDEAIDLARSHAEVDLNTGRGPLPRPELLTRLTDKDGLICQAADVIDPEVIGSAPCLKVIANVAVGYNNIDLTAARRRGIIVTNTPDVLTETTADFAWALLMATARRVAEADKFLRAGGWRGPEFRLLLGSDIHGKTLGVIGFGRIGRAVARRALGFRMRVLYHDTIPADVSVERELNATFTDKVTLLRESDFVTLHCLLTPETRHLIDETALRMMKKTAFLINAARGPIVDEQALVRALTEQWIAGAGLDVYEEEPRVHPDMPLLENVVLAPHIASASRTTRLNMAMLAVNNCLAVLEGKAPLTPVIG